MTQQGSAASGVWSRLWRRGTLHSCATGIAGNYDGAILAFWRRQFQALQSGARVVDVGSGNGPLLLLAAALRRERSDGEPHGLDLDLHGVDIAQIDPVRDVPDGARQFAGMHFHPATPTERLPFEDGSVQLLCSQFGIEYAPRDAAVGEAVRVVAPRGRIALVLHSDDSIVARTSIAQRQAAAFLRADCPVVERAVALVPVLHRASTTRGMDGATDAEALRQAFNTSAAALMDEIERVPAAELLQRVAQQLQAALRLAATAPDEAIARLHALRESIEDEDTRLAHLQAALLDQDALDAMSNTLVASGFRTTLGTIEQRPGVKMGWTLEAVRDD